MSGRQRGQALVGALVVTTLAFLMAGAVAVGASALLSQESNNGPNASSRDLSSQDALAAAVAWVAGKGSSGGPAACTQPTLQTQTTLPSNGYPSQAQWCRVNGVPSDPLTLKPFDWSNACPVLAVPASSSGHFLIWFTASGNANAWVDTDKRPDCKQSPADCSDLVSGPIHVLDCSGSGLYLHIHNSTQSPAMVMLAEYSSSGGSIYVLAAPTGVAGGPTYEVADIWVSQDGATTALRLEGAL